ncbi:MAG: peptidoglycan-binding domain-containing protein [Clostridium sp.]|uniref:peptidoglycan-binding domain-containing protein n=1 Tax=Clostridium sp. TaxID=1506 RepID=UPI00304B95C4
MPDIGKLQVQLYKVNTAIPITNAAVTITRVDGDTREQMGMLTTDADGQTKIIELQTPPVDRSIDPNNKLIPYSLYDVKVVAEGFRDVLVKGCQILPYQTALQICNLIPLNVNRENEEGGEEKRIIAIPPNVQFGDFPPKIPEDEEKPLPPPPTGFVVLPEPVVPEFITVHAGVPTNTGAPNYTVPYKDYIKNVASGEIYATWPETTIRANIYCIISFTLNRIYTEWYRGKGYKFDITNSTAYDQAFSYGRNIYENISLIVDEIFSTYIKRAGAKQPLFAQYCDGRNVKCPGWLTQWGSKDLGEQGYVPYEILTNFYGNDIVFETAKNVVGSPESYPGYTLKEGTSGEPVKTVQTFLNRIAQNYPLIPKVAVDGIYNPATTEQVKVFQKVFKLPQTGQVDYATWYKISDLYVGVTKIAELRSSTEIGTDSKVSYAYFIPHCPYKGAVDVPEIKYPMD